MLDYDSGRSSILGNLEGIENIKLKSCFSLDERSYSWGKASSNIQH